MDADRRVHVPQRLLLLQRPHVLRAVRRRQPADRPLALRLPARPSGGAAGGAAAHHAARHRGAPARVPRAAVEPARPRPRRRRGQDDRGDGGLPAHARRIGDRSGRLLGPPPLPGRAARRGLRRARAPRPRLRRLWPRRVLRGGEPGGERHAHVRRAHVPVVRLGERSRARRRALVGGSGCRSSTASTASRRASSTSGTSSSSWPSSSCSCFWRCGRSGHARGGGSCETRAAPAGRADGARDRHPHVHRPPRASARRAHRPHAREAVHALAAQQGRAGASGGRRDHHGLLLEPGHGHARRTCAACCHCTPTARRA